MDGGLLIVEASLQLSTSKHRGRERCEDGPMKSVNEIASAFREAGDRDLQELIETYQLDSRKGVRKLVESARKRLERLEAEISRIESLCYYEKKHSDYDYICGIDEVGRGPLAGPVVAGAVILPKDCRILYINDSKKLSPAKREELYDEIREKALSVGFGVVSPARIDEINILNATYEAMRDAISALSVKPGILLNDAVTIPGVSIPQVPIIKGDAKSISIGAASIMAKVYRDRMMVEYDSLFPGYAFASNKGYGSKEHMEALKRLGPCPIHRRSFIGGIVDTIPDD